MIEQSFTAVWNARGFEVVKTRPMFKGTQFIVQKDALYRFTVRDGETPDSLAEQLDQCSPDFFARCYRMSESNIAMMEYIESL